MGRHDQQPPAEALSTAEREWLVPSAVLTGLLGLAALLLMPVAGYSEIPPYFSRFVTWMTWSLFGAMLLLLLHVIRLRKAGVTEPVAHLKAWFTARKVTVLAATAGMALAGLDLIFFMWIKPEVTALSPFWADKLFADIDYALFGIDPWRLFAGFDLTFHAWAYSFFWFVAIMATLVWLFAQPPSQARSTSILSYFMLWSLFGPIGQMLGSSAGPIFYERVGLGDRFSGLHENIPWVTQQISDYLWAYHTTGEPGVSAGISAMPSLHIATVAWIVLAFGSLKSRLTPLAVLFVLYIWALSVALGWHYSIDGVAGLMGAVACHQLSRRFLSRRAIGAQRASKVVPVG